MSFGLGLVGLNADLRGGESIREGGSGVVDLGGLPLGAPETRLDEADRARDPAVAELDRARGLGASLVVAAGLLAAGTRDDPGALGNSIWGVT